MSCFYKLADSRFLNKLSTNLKAAQSKLHKLDKQIPLPGGFPMQRKDKISKFKYLMRVGEFNERLLEMDLSDSNALYYLCDFDILYLVAKSKQLITNTCYHSFITNGDVPFYRSRIYIGKDIYHTAMIDLTFQLIPPTSN